MGTKSVTMSVCEIVVVNDRAGESKRLLMLHYCVQHNISLYDKILMDFSPRSTPDTSPPRTDNNVV